MFDRRLYGSSFFTALIPLIGGLFVQFVTQIVFTRIHPIIFVPYLIGYFFVILICAFATKNAFSEKRIKAFHPMGYVSAIILLFVSIISTYFPFVFHIEDVLLSLIIYWSIFGFAQIGFHLALLNMVVVRQRKSILQNIQLTENFFKKASENWKNELSSFTNLEKMVQTLEEGEYISNLFEQGYFDLVVLWSCNVIGNIIDDATSFLIAEYPEKQKLFRKMKKGRNGREYFDSERYPVQLNNLGFSIKTINKSEEKFNLEILWDKRNDIAHRNDFPTFFITIETLKTIVKFSNTMPKLLLEHLSPID